MKRIVAAMLVVGAVVLAPPPALAQEGLEIEASVGLRGYVAPTRPTTITVRVSSQVLFVGDLQVSIGSISLFTPVEVPAGVTKEYVLSLPAAGNNRRAVVQLVPKDGDQAAVKETVGLQVPTNELLVGVLGGAGIEAGLAAATTVPFGTKVTVLALETGDLTNDLTPLSYLVIGRDALASASPESLPPLKEWVTNGGRLIGTSDDLGRLAAATSPAAALSASATLAGAGRGELIVVDDPAAPADWGPVLRDVPPMQISSNSFAEEFGIQMIQAASSGGESTTPGLPWLLGVLAVYVVIIGPLNFFLLRRRGKPELAWTTIPVLSIAMVAVLWFVGRTQLDDRIVTHATIMVQDGDETRARSTLIVVAGGEGNHSLDVPPGWSVAPLDASMMFGQQSRLETTVEASPSGGVRLGFELPNLGAATATAGWSPPTIPLGFDMREDGNALVVTVTNNSDLSFWAWGVGTASSASAARGPLEPGQSQDIRRLVANQTFFGGGGGGMIADAVFNTGLLDFESSGRDPWARVWPLAEAMARSEPTILAESPYFFGYTDDLLADVHVDGGPERAHGPTLVVIPLAGHGMPNSTRVAEVIEVVGADFVDAGPGYMYAHGAEALHLRFILDPETTGDLKLVSLAGNLPGVEGMEIYNWERGEFDRYEWRAAFTATGHLSPTGEVMVSVLMPGGESSDMDLPTGGLILESA